MGELEDLAGVDEADPEYQRLLAEARAKRAQDREWRIFTGWWMDGEPEMAYLDKRTTWDAAHALMVAKFERWTQDECLACATNAASQLPKLRALEPNTEWQGEVEGDDYVITRNMAPVEL